MDSRRSKGAQRRRRLLIVEVERSIMEYQALADVEDEDEERDAMFVLVLYSLGRLCRALESPAKASGEWQHLRQDLVELSRPALSMDNRRTLLSRLDRIYHCLYPG